MKKEEFFEVLGELDDDIIQGAMTTMKKKVNWKAWGAMAACLCLIAGTTVFIRQNFAPDGTSLPGIGGFAGTDQGNSEGGYSVAVYPATESQKNVDSAEVVSLTEKEALDHPLAKYLPRQLPDGFHYGRGSVYNTTMKDGTQYHMLRVEYISGTIPEQQYSEDGGAIVPDPGIIGDCFIISVLNYEPKTDKGIYSSVEEVTVSLLEENGGIFIRRGECCIGAFPETAGPEIILKALRNME